MRSVSLALLVSGFTLAAGSAVAQAPVAVPDQMAFDIPYGSPITADRAIPLVAAVVAEAKKSPRNWKLAVAVVDTNGDLVYFYKMDNTMIASVMIAQYKARTAARYRRPSEAFNTVMQQPTGAYVATLETNIAASPGGIPLIEDGKLIGAIGCSGAAGIQDAAACKVAAGMLQ
jgi:uncharacterized protein GlcG (DUF336 family)